MFNNNDYIQLNDKIEKILRRAEAVGCGHNGIVYLLPDKKIIKVFKDKRVCKSEYNIFKKTRGSKYFPKVWDHGEYFIIRDYIGGERLDKYIIKNGFNKEIAYNLIELIKEFNKLGFNKLDIRCKDLYIGEHSSLKVIDPKNNYSRNIIYPRHLMKGLYKLGGLDEFLLVAKDEYPEVYELWNFRIQQYFTRGIK